MTFVRAPRYDGSRLDKAFVVGFGFFWSAAFLFISLSALKAGSVAGFLLGLLLSSPGLFVFVAVGWGWANGRAGSSASLMLFDDKEPQTPGLLISAGKRGTSFSCEGARVVLPSELPPATVAMVAHLLAGPAWWRNAQGRVALPPAAEWISPAMRPLDRENAASALEGMVASAAPRAKGAMARTISALRLPGILIAETPGASAPDDIRVAHIVPDDPGPPA